MTGEVRSIRKPRLRFFRGRIPAGAYDHIDDEGQLQRPLIVPEPEYGDGVFEVGQNRQPAQQAAVVEHKAQHHARQDEHQFQRLAFHIFHGRQIVEYGHGILDRAAVALQRDGGGDVAKLAHDLHGHDLAVFLSGAADGVGNHGAEAEQIAENDGRIDHDDEPFAFGFF